MIPKNYYQQFLSRNSHELVEMVQSFNELNQIHGNSFGLYLDMNGWEVIDLNFSKTIIRHEYKHLRGLTIDLKCLRDSYSVVGCFLWSKKPKKNLTHAVKHLLKYYTNEEFSKIFPEYENRIKVQNLADCD